MIDTAPNPVLDAGLDSSSNTSDNEAAPLPTGLSSPCSPIDFDSTTGIRTGKKVIARTATAILSTEDRRKVHFAKAVVNKEVRHIQDFTPEEIRELWLTAEDYMSIKVAVKETVRMMMTGVQIGAENEEFCIRGLEFRTKLGSRARNKNKLKARSAVLNEQEMQREEGFSDPQFIAMLSMDASAACCEMARFRGLHDEREVSNNASKSEA